MALTVGTNSWVTVAEADTYFLTRWGASDWAGFSAANKETLLISAYNWIQQQAIFSISPTSTDAKVKQAQYEAAWFLYNYNTEMEKRRALYAQGVKAFEISKFSETLQAPEFPAFIADILEDEIVTAGGTFPTVSRELNT